MINMFKLYILISLLLRANIVFAVEKTEDRFDIKLSQHGRDKNKIGKPALIQFTYPEDKERSYLVDAALKGIYAPAGTDLEVSGILEIHKNTLVDKEYDTSTISIMAGKYLLKSDCTDVPGLTGIKTCKNNLFGDASISYQKDNERDKESILAILEFSGTAADWYLNNVHPTSNFPAYWSPTFGLEYENFIKSVDGKEGDLGRLYGNFEIGIYPFFNDLKGRLSLTISYSLWIDFSKDDDLGIEDDSHNFRRADVYYLLTPNDNKVAVSLVLSWFDGEDPRNKKPNQEYIQFGLGIKY